MNILHMKYAGDIDKIEQSYRDGSHKKRRFSISVPRACYISAAMAVCFAFRI